MAKSFRKERVNETIRELLSERGLTDIKDPRVGFVTITAVRVSSDLSTAKVHYSVLGDEEDRVSTHKGLISARSFMRSEIAKVLKVRTSPELRFVYDDSLDRVDHLRELLEGLEARPREGEWEG